VAHSDHAQECPDFRDVLTGAPLGDFVNILRIREPTLQHAAVSNCDNFFCTEDQLISAEGAATILDALYDAVEVLKVFPDKAADSQIVRYAFFGSVGEVVLRPLDYPAITCHLVLIFSHHVYHQTVLTRL